MAYARPATYLLIRLPNAIIMGGKSKFFIWNALIVDRLTGLD